MSDGKNMFSQKPRVEVLSRLEVQQIAHQRYPDRCGWVGTANEVLSHAVKMHKSYGYIMMDRLDGNNWGLANFPVEYVNSEGKPWYICCENHNHKWTLVPWPGPPRAYCTICQEVLYRSCHVCKVNIHTLDEYEEHLAKHGT